MKTTCIVIRKCYSTQCTLFFARCPLYFFFTFTFKNTTICNILLDILSNKITKHKKKSEINGILKLKPHTRYLLTLLPYVIIVLEKSNTLFKPYFFVDFGNNVNFYNFSVKDWALMFPKMDQTLKLETLEIWSKSLLVLLQYNHSICFLAI